MKLLFYREAGGASCDSPHAKVHVLISRQVDTDGPWDARAACNKNASKNVTRNVLVRNR
jgi:hypothetical protein